MYLVGVHHGSRRHGRHHARPYTPEEVDFIAIYILPEDAWYIVPIDVIDGRLGLCIHTYGHPKRGPWMPHREAWHLLRQTGAHPILPDPEPNFLTRRAGGGPRRKRKRLRPMATDSSALVI